MKFDIWGSFQKPVEKFQASLKSDKNNGYFTLKPLYIFDYISLISSWNGKCFRQNVSRKSKYILCSVTCFRKSYCLWNNVEKYCRAWQAADDNMAHVHCILDKTLTICNARCFSTAPMVAWTGLSVNVIHTFPALLTLQLYIYDIISICCVFRCISLTIAEKGWNM